MRSSRLSRDTAKLFDRAPSISPPRRTTRSSLARFAHAAATPDIEDSITPATKRRRAASTTTTTKPVKRERITKKEEEEEEYVVKKEEDSDSEEVKKAAPARRARKPARSTTVKDETTGESTTTTQPPSDWEETYAVLRAMRSPGGAAYPAVVDTMGCERLADEASSPRDQRFHTLVALMLSSQTKDTVNAVVMARLKSELPAHADGAPKGLNLDNVLAVEPEMLNQMIWQVGFHNNKTKYIKKAAEILRDEWDGDIPDTIAGLTALPGVGPKMAYLCLSHAWGRTEGIGVDVHVHRITNLWGWHAGGKTKTPEETRLALQSWLPRDRWREINGLLVGLGQSVCLPQGSRCGDCDIGLRGLCKSADRRKLNEGRARRAAAGDDKENCNDEKPVKSEPE